MTFNPGDVVRLKSGGPLMTVVEVGETAMLKEPAVFCTWFESEGGKNVLKKEAFAPAVLEIANSKNPVSVRPRNF